MDEEEAWLSEQPSELERHYSEKFERSERRTATLTRVLTNKSVVLLHGVHSIQNARDEMEDAHQAVLCHGDGQDDKTAIADALGAFSYFAVFDGHGGTQAAEFAGERLSCALAEEASTLSRDPTEALRLAFAKVEAEWLVRARQQELFDGTTAAVALLDRAQGRCFIGNVGDSEVVLGRRDATGKTCCQVLTEVHNVRGNPAEADRVIAAGGRLWHRRLGHPKLNPRVCSLAISRSIGDLFFKDEEYVEGTVSGLIADPYMSNATWDPAECGEQILILGCDGLWDTVTHEDALEFAFNQRAGNQGPQGICEQLVKLAQENGSSDNITVMVVVF
eukprot:TRINITY_DN11707_c0_g1_i2.p1 TRINITY_DN11707_c0_g1~~TRINITY_DN11707_c0_g1_i2.p1  ORF type:complete len:333 (+),score=67.83 TRINITY_DN11707_c0_g1_i2:92-1090(+)